MTSPSDLPSTAEALIIHAKSLAQACDHLWEVLGELSIPLAFVEDSRAQHKVEFTTDQLVRAFLYASVRDYSQNELAERLAQHPTLVKTFRMDSAPRQQTLNHAWNRFNLNTRRMIEAAGNGIAKVCIEHDVIAETLVPHIGESETDPDADYESTPNSDSGTDTREYVRRKSRKSVRLARKHAFPAFDTDRAANKQYSDEDLLDMFFRTAATNGSASEEGEVGWLLGDDHTCHGSTLLRAIKKFGTPANDDQQLDINDFGDSDRISVVESIRDELATAFGIATESVLATLQSENVFDDRRTVAAIDVTHERFWPSPWLDKDAGQSKPAYPKMVSGYTTNDGDYARGYKYATLTLVGGSTLIVLGIEPVKENSTWEGDDAASYSLGAVVDRLLERAQDVADIDEVYMDREFYAIDALEAVDGRDLLYTVPVPRYESDLSNIEDIKNHPSADAAVLHDAVVGNGEASHCPEFCYVPTDREDADGTYAIFATNREHVDPDEIRQITNGYRRRWEIENQYKTIKQFKPQTSSTDYRIRLAGFVLAALLYNLWRLVDALIKIGLDKPIRSSPVVTAGAFSRVIGTYLRRVT